LVTKDRKKYFFENLLYNAVNNIQKLYDQHKSKKYIMENNKNDELMRSSVVLGMKYFTNLILNNNRNLSNKILKELFNEFELLSYNNNNLIKKTWNNENIDNNNKYIRELKKLLFKIESYKIPNYNDIILKLKKKNEKIKSILKNIIYLFNKLDKK
jgi:hypothetical protein